MLTEGASKAAKLLKAIQDEEVHLAEIAQGAADLVAEVSSQRKAGQATDDVLRRWSKTARDLAVNYLHSFHMCISSRLPLRRRTPPHRRHAHLLRTRLQTPHVAAHHPLPTLSHKRRLQAIGPDRPRTIPHPPGWLVLGRQLGHRRPPQDPDRLSALYLERDAPRPRARDGRGASVGGMDTGLLAADAEDAEGRQRRRYKGEIAALGAQLRELGHVPVVPPRRPGEEEDMIDHGARGRHRPVPAIAIAQPANGPAGRGHDMAQNENQQGQDEIVPGDSASRLVGNNGGLALPSVPRGLPFVPGAASAPAAARAAAGNVAAGFCLAFDGRRNNDGLPADVAPAVRDAVIARFWADKSLAELEGLLWEGWDRFFEFRLHMLEALFPLVFGRGRSRRPDRHRVMAIREAREKLLEEIFVLEDMIDDRRRPPGAVPVPYPGQGMLCKYFLGGNGLSPATEARVLGAHRLHL
ncbi:hypothetical protein CH63R_14551 [Colletotrichum higginsianum IMI 349063]|uniref:Uncharacterized protein n=1 Tax=Colletotrichum higginsianum (strain IMI 349063) TaxID=759273 RepID=A0A1B7XQE3_COLHI|nr:hypothetical protein CH63R_14551 [Colletotrichum higginsianum IMI 349063]OBR01979.1 hypothetical protein CH63R_14551 [Colletotrichum higginsianum IMI 349063]